MIISEVHDLSIQHAPWYVDCTFLLNHGEFEIVTHDKRQKWQMPCKHDVYLHNMHFWNVSIDEFTALTVRKVRTLLLPVSPKNNSSCFTQEFLVCGLLRKRHLCWKKRPPTNHTNPRDCFTARWWKDYRILFYPEKLVQSTVSATNHENHLVQRCCWMIRISKFGESFVQHVFLRWYFSCF